MKESLDGSELRRLREVLTIGLLALMLIIQCVSSIGQLPSYTLVVNSEPIREIQFQIDGQEYSTPWSGILTQGNYTIVIPATWSQEGRTYRFVSWEDGSSNPSRIINLNQNITISCKYELIYHRLNVITFPQDIQFSIDGTELTSPWSDLLYEGVHLVTMPSTIVLEGWPYLFLGWEDSSINPLRTINLTQDLTIQASFKLKSVVDVSGNQIIKVIFVEFPDAQHSTTDESIQTKLNLVHGYFENTSYSELNLKFDVSWTWIKLGRNMTYYGTGNFTKENHYSFVVDSIEAAFPYTNLTVSKRLLIVHSGGDQAGTRVQNDIWSFAYYVPNDFLTSRGKIRLFAASVSESDPFGLIAHEIGHTLGLPDLYNLTTMTTGQEDNFVGPWDLMASGSWNPNYLGTHPAHLSSWSMTYLSWLPRSQVIYVDPKEEQTITIVPLEKPSLGLRTIVVPLGDNRFYMIEGRADPYLQQGIIIYFVDNSTFRVLVQDANKTTPTLTDAAFDFDPTELRVPVFINVTNDVAVIILQISENEDRLLVGPAAEGNRAMEATNSIYAFGSGILNAEHNANLTLRDARADLEKAISLYSSANFSQAEFSAQNGHSRMKSELKKIAQILIDTADVKISNSSKEAFLWLSPDLTTSEEALQRAKRSFDEGNFVQAIRTIKYEFEPAILQAESAYQENIQVVSLIILVIIAVLFAVAIKRLHRRRYYG